MLFPDGETVLPKTNQEIFSDHKKHFYKLNGAMAHLPVIYILGTKYYCKSALKSQKPTTFCLESSPEVCKLVSLPPSYFTKIYH